VETSHDMGTFQQFRDLPDPTHIFVPMTPVLTSSIGASGKISRANG